MLECRFTIWTLVIAVIAPCPALAQDGPPLVPSQVQLSEVATEAINADWLTDSERSQLRIFHGVWDEQDLITPELRALAALTSWRLDDSAFEDATTPIELRAQALLHAGELRRAYELLETHPTLAAMRIRTQALAGLADYDSARQAASQASSIMQRRTIDSAAQLTDGIEALLVGARVAGQPARDFHMIMQLFARAHQQLDRLYWPAKLAEARLLLDKDSPREALGALHEVLTLNPRCSEAWYRMGVIAAKQFAFDSANLAARTLRQINREHPLANLLEARVRLAQDDPDGALAVLAPVIERWPRMREAHELKAAAHAIAWDAQATQVALDHYDELSPGSARAYHAVGAQLSFNRQYEMAADMLAEAIKREPRWPAPQIELGLMELQSGRDHVALDVLEDVAELDPFNKRAANSLFLLQELTTYNRMETEFFTVRYKPGVDEVMVDMMREQLDRIHKQVYDRFQFELDRKTIVELMPNHERFAVRITGMPAIHTVAACTGPVLAMEVPREGRKSEHFGQFDWPRVLRHEYTHTMTLAQTRNRIPHWFTEAAAVDMELAPRTYSRCVLLADAWRNGTLFSLDEIKWGFIRPRGPNDRAKAYAQSHWMIEFMDQRFGDSGVARLLEAYFNGMREAAAVEHALGVSREQFFHEFLEWAGTQVAQWGLDAKPSFEQLLDEQRQRDPELMVQMLASQHARLDAIGRIMTRQIGEPAGLLDRSLMPDQWPPLVRPAVDITDELVEQWISDHPDHPDLWELKIRRWIARHDDTVGPEIVPWLERYAALRPVDEFPHKRLAQYWLAGETPEKAIEHLEFLNAREEYTPVYAVELARLYRGQKNLGRALENAIHALHINPYHAPNRELTAAIAIEKGDLVEARRHIYALTLVEPDRRQHERRLERIDELIEQRHNGAGS